MKVRSKIFKCLFWLSIIALLVAPIGLICEISNREKQQYAVPTPPKFVETAFGAIVASERRDMEESVSASGVFQSFTYEYMELKQKDPSQIRWLVCEGDEIQTGQILGTYRGAEVLATCTGLITQMQTYSSTNAFIKVQQANPVVLVCDVSPSVLISLKLAKELKTADGEAAELVYAATIRNSDGSTRVHLQIDSEAYFLNQSVEEMYFYTGNSYTQALVLPKDCLYQKVAGEDELWYVRQVTEDGVFLAEVEVKIGYLNQEYVCVTGITEGQYFDAGYAQFSEGGGLA